MLSFFLAFLIGAAFAETPHTHLLCEGPNFSYDITSDGINACYTFTLDNQVAAVRCGQIVLGKIEVPYVGGDSILVIKGSRSSLRLFGDKANSRQVNCH